MTIKCHETSDAMSETITLTPYLLLYARRQQTHSYLRPTTLLPSSPISSRNNRICFFSSLHSL